MVKSIHTPHVFAYRIRNLAFKMYAPRKVEMQIKFSELPFLLNFFALSKIKSCHLEIFLYVRYKIKERQSNFSRNNCTSRIFRAGNKNSYSFMIAKKSAGYLLSHFVTFSNAHTTLSVFLTLITLVSIIYFKQFFFFNNVGTALFTDIGCQSY